MYVWFVTDAPKLKESIYIIPTSKIDAKWYVIM